MNGLGLRKRRMWHQERRRREISSPNKTRKNPCDSGNLEQKNSFWFQEESSHKRHGKNVLVQDTNVLIQLPVANETKGRSKSLVNLSWFRKEYSILLLPVRKEQIDQMKNKQGEFSLSKWRVS